MGIIGPPVTSAATFAVTSAICEATAATFVPTVAIFAMSAEIFERVSGKEFDRSDFKIGLTAAAHSAAVSAFDLFS